MVKEAFGPYDTFVRDRLEFGERPLSFEDIYELLKIEDVVKYRDDFIRLICAYEHRLFHDVSCYSLVSSIWLIVSLKGASYEPAFNRAWSKFLGFLESDFAAAPSSFDIDAAFNGIRLGMDAGLDVSMIIEKVARYLKASASPAESDVNRRDIWSVVTNHFDVLTSIYQSGQYEAVSLEIDDSLEELKAILGK